MRAVDSGPLRDQYSKVERIELHNPQLLKNQPIIADIFLHKLTHDQLTLPPLANLRLQCNGSQLYVFHGVFSSFIEAQMNTF